MAHSGELRHSCVWNEADDLRCKRTNRQEELRDKPIGRGPLHALDCRHSPSRIKIHHSVCKALREQLRHLGADVEEECPVPEISRWWLEFGEWKCQEALLDLSVRWPGAWILRRLLDITVRDPEADRYQPAAQHIPETTAEKAHKEKNARYPATHGAAVETIPLEPLGRVGKEGLMVIEAIATDAAMIRGDRTAAPNVSRRIRHTMEYTLITDVANAQAEAAGGSGMQAWERGAHPRLGMLSQGARKRNVVGESGERAGCVLPPLQQHESR